MSSRISVLAFLGVLTLPLSGGLSAQAAEVHVAVAANFTEPAKQIAAAFHTKTGDDAVLSFGASGQLYTQITQAAPFEVFLSADDERPKKAVQDGVGVEGSSFTYAIGTLVLWSKAPTVVAGENSLKAGSFSKLSIANPTAAPYGTAAIETLKSLKIFDQVQPKIVQGNSIAQAYQFVDTGNAELGFVALSQIINNPAGSRWIVPAALYTPIRQDAVLLKKGAGNQAATAFIEFLKGPDARAIIERFGYTLADSK